MQRQDTQSSLGKGSEVPIVGARRTSTWKSNAASAHARTLNEQVSQAVPEPAAIHNAWTYIIAMIMCMGAAAYGYDTGFFGGTLALESFKREFGNTSQTKANLVSLFQGGSFFGAGLQLPFTERFGRKYSVIFANVLFIASAFAQTFAAGSVPVFMFGRFLGGFAVGFLSLVIPVYLSEFAPASIRGRLIGGFDIFIQVGTLGGFWINYGIDGTLPSNRFQWQLPVFIQFVPAAILLIGAPFCPETPRWLILKGRDEEALRSLCSIRKLPVDDAYIQYEYRQTKEQVEGERLIRGDQTLWQLTKDLLKSGGHRNRVFLGMALIFFKTFSGVQAVNYYSPIIFEQLGFHGTQNSLFATGIYGTCKFVFTLIFGIWIVDRVGRRLPLMAGSIVLSLCLIFIGGYLTGVGPKADDAPRTAGDYVSITALFLYASVYCLGWNSVPLTLVSEIFTIRFRTLSMTICLMWQWLCTFSIVQIMPHALENITTRTYFIFGFIFICGAPFVYFVVPETKGLSLEYMDRLFGGDRTDVEQALEEGEKEKHMTQHVENAGSRIAAPTMAPIRE